MTLINQSNYADIPLLGIVVNVNVRLFRLRIIIGPKPSSADEIAFDTKICWPFLGRNPALNIFALVCMTILGIPQIGDHLEIPHHFCLLCHSRDLRSYFTICKQNNHEQQKKQSYTVPSSDIVYHWPKNFPSSTGPTTSNMQPNKLADRGEVSRTLGGNNIFIKHATI